MRIFLSPPYPVLLIPHPTGVTYVVESGGYACSHMEAEGFLVPIGGCQLLAPDSWEGNWHGDQLTSARYDAIDSELAHYDFRSDRSAENEEAWVHGTARVWVDDKPEQRLVVLIWQNSD